MKLGSLKEGGRDGTLIVVSRDLARAVKATGIAPTMQRALEDWSNAAPRLNAVYEALEAGTPETVNGEPVFAVDFAQMASPLPRAYEFVDGSAYLPHVARVRKARGAEVPESFYTDPLMYQAVSAGFYGPRDPVLVADEAQGIDLEAEIVVVTDDVPQGASPAEAAGHIQLVGLVNDVSLRNLIPGELAKGWKGNKLHLPLLTHVNGKWFGAPEAGVDMQFDFAQLVAHAAKTRPLSAGTIVGSGTVANEDTSLGASCFAEQRTVEALRDGKPSTPFMSFGDTVRIEMIDKAGHSIFGAIEQRIQKA